jgi:microcompartment protein CcmK/EutM
LLIARVIGTVVASRKEPELEGLKFLLLQGSDSAGKTQSGFVVAADAVGAGVGELVLYATGSSARQTAVTQNRPVDATVMAIIDLVEERGELSYRKDAE